MKIILIGPVFPYRGGIAHFTTLLTKRLLDAGHTVQVVSFKNNTRPGFTRVKATRITARDGKKSLQNTC